MRELSLRSRQGDLRVDTALLRRIARALLENRLGLREYQLGIRLVSAREMAELNATYLRHEGATDVIAFDHRESPDAPLYGELFICPDVAADQARQFRTAWTRELTRYLAHGVLHLLGFDDLSPGPRRKMKQREGRLLKALATEFPLTRLERKTS